MTNPQKLLETWTTLKQLIISAKNNCKQKLAECKEHGQQLKELLASLNKDWTEIHEDFNTEQKVNWIKAGFTYSQTKNLVEKGFSDLTFLTWVKNTKKLEPHTLSQEELTQLEWESNDSSSIWSRIAKARMELERED